MMREKEREEGEMGRRSKKNKKDKKKTEGKIESENYASLIR
jgi:hypothetical protein